MREIEEIKQNFLNELEEAKESMNGEIEQQTAIAEENSA